MSTFGSRHGSRFGSSQGSRNGSISGASPNKSANSRTRNRLIDSSVNRSGVSESQDLVVSICEGIATDYIANTQGCILLTSPHSVRLKKTEGKLKT